MVDNVEVKKGKYHPEGVLAQFNVTFAIGYQIGKIVPNLKKPR